MNQVQEVLIQLLTEIDDVCQRNSISYTLMGPAALDAYRTGSLAATTMSIDVGMTLKDAKRVRNLLMKTGRKNRMVDSLYDNDDYPDFSMRYSDTSTTAIDLANYKGLKSQGIAVRILILRTRTTHGRRSKAAWSLFRYYERGWYYNHPSYDHGRPYKKEELAIRRRAARQMALSKSHYVRQMLKLFELTQHGSTRNVALMVRNTPRNTVRFRAKTFAGTMLVGLEGKYFLISSKPAQLFSAYYGSAWRRRVIDSSDCLARHIYDAEISYSQLLSSLGEEGLGLPEPTLFHDVSLANTEVRPFLKTVNDAWRIVLRTGARVRLWEQYLPQKDAILELYEQGDWNQLEVILAEYNKTARRYHKLGYGMCFDEDILTVYCAMLKRGGNYDFAREFEAEAKRDYQPMTLS